MLGGQPSIAGGVSNISVRLDIATRILIDLAHGNFGAGAANLSARALELADALLRENARSEERYEGICALCSRCEICAPQERRMQGVRCEKHYGRHA